MKYTTTQYIWGGLRLAMGWIFIWAFLDKLLGLGFATARDASWLAGGSPTAGFLKFATHGPFSAVFQSLADSAAVEWLFMLGLLLLGLALLLGICVKLASWFGSLLLLLMWLALLPPENNPFLDDHIIYIIVLFGINKAQAGQYLGLGSKWSQTKLVRRHSWLE